MDWKALIFDHWQAKLICLLLAFGLWFYVANEGFEIKEVSDPVPLDTINLDERLAVADDLGPITISVRPSSGLQQNVTAEDFDAYIDLEGLGKGTYELPVKIVSHDATVQVLRLDPETVRVTLDDRVEEAFSVVPKIEGSPGEGYTIGDPELSEESVRIGGAESLVGSIRSVVAEVDVSGEQSEIKRSVELKAINGDGEVINAIYIEPKTIEVVVPIFQEADVKTVGVKVKTEGQPQQGYFVKNIISDPSTVVLRGAREDLQEVEFIETETIDLDGISSDVERDMPLEIPENLELEGDETVKVKVELEGNEVTKAIKGLFEFKNLPEGRGLETFSPSNASVTVVGSADKISSLTENDVRVIVDLAGRNAGTYTIGLVNANAQVPENVSVVSLDTKEIEVKIK